MKTECYRVAFFDEDDQPHCVTLKKDDAESRAVKLMQGLRDAGLRSEIYAQDAGPVAADWTLAYPAKHREVLRRHGIGPAAHSAAREYNNRLIERAEAGLDGQHLADAADALFDELVSEREPEDPDPDDFLDWKDFFWMDASERDEK